MNRWQEMVMRFHRRFACPINGKPTMVHSQELLHRCRLIHEEAAEITTAAAKQDMYKLVDALGDLIYVTLGFAITLGVDMDPIMNEIQSANMTKLDAKDGSGKVLKPDYWKPPDIETCLQTQKEIV